MYKPLIELDMRLYNLLQVRMLCRYDCMCDYAVCMLLCVAVIVASSTDINRLMSWWSMSEVYRLKSVVEKTSP